jgi:hypothetical protein
MPDIHLEAEANRQLELAVEAIEVTATQGRVNIFWAQTIGGVAVLFARQDLAARVRATISGLTSGDLFCNAITNIDPNTADRTRPIDLPTAEQAALDHPLCTSETLIAQLRAGGEGHVQLALIGDLDRAVQLASTPRELEDIGCALAILGRFDEAVSFIDAQSVDDERKAQIRSVVLFEKCRRNLPGVTEAIEQAGVQGEGRVTVALALTLRLPWLGYPFSDW